MAPTYLLRPAVKTDFPSIRRIIYSARINPGGLDWRRFMVACRADPGGGGEIIGCGQVKPHRDGSRELASIAVVPNWRGQGIARAIIERLMAVERARGATSSPQVLYLTCRAHLGPFYEQFGFQRVSFQEMPPYFRRISRIVGLLQKLTRREEGLLVMGRVLE